MSKIITAGRDVCEVDPIAELSAVGLKGIFLNYREISHDQFKRIISRSRDIRNTDDECRHLFNAQDLPSAKDLKDNLGQLVGLKKYNGAFSIYTGELMDDEYPSSVVLKDFFKMNEDGIVQNWEISDVVMRQERDKRDNEREDYKICSTSYDYNHAMGNTHYQLPFFHSLICLLEKVKPRMNIKSAKIWVETEHGFEFPPGFYLCGVESEKLQSETQEFDYFTGIRKFVSKYRRGKGCLAIFAPENYPSLLPEYGRDSKEQLERAFYLKHKLNVFCKMDWFPYPDEKGIDGFSKAIARLVLIKRKYDETIFKILSVI